MENKSESRQNTFVFLALALLTLLEFWVAVTLMNPAVPLLLIAIVKSSLIVYFFMHVYRLWREEEHS
jgi:caa(3)-type oxidase subunit IV